MVWCQANIDNEQQFPSKIGTVLAASKYTLSANKFFRCAVPKDIPSSYSSDVQAAVPCVCPYLLPPLPDRASARIRATSQHELQALRLVRRRASAGIRQGLLGTIR